MKVESDEDAAEFDTNFRAMIFASDPQLYDKMFVQDEREKKALEEEIEWFHPQSQEDIDRIMKEIETDKA